MSQRRRTNAERALTLVLPTLPSTERRLYLRSTLNASRLINPRRLHDGLTVQFPAMATTDNRPSPSTAAAPTTTYLTVSHPRDPGTFSAQAGLDVTTGSACTSVVGRSNAAPAARINKTELRANAGGRHVYQLASAAFSWKRACGNAASYDRAVGASHCGGLGQRRQRASAQRARSSDLRLQVLTTDCGSAELNDPTTAVLCSPCSNRGNVTSARELRTRSLLLLVSRAVAAHVASRVQSSGPRRRTPPANTTTRRRGCSSPRFRPRQKEPTHLEAAGGSDWNDARQASALISLLGQEGQRKYFAPAEQEEARTTRSNAASDPNSSAPTASKFDSLVKQLDRLFTASTNPLVEQKMAGAGGEAVTSCQHFWEATTSLKFRQAKMATFSLNRVTAAGADGTSEVFEIV
ncbi:hypothetical protein HPB52_001614 [Rhipicephalus sanguineus]|uniref:Uncharacterized protein n=1 Tax=Rhipicephalus sanguineus TaxID=34632 RepID=A0A9D4SR81_RHISA|nr:hypothetical protein HPB52_001614 [Rhipicephalus sanguineus]